jgi:hypothetical protein
MWRPSKFIGVEDIWRPMIGRKCAINVGLGKYYKSFAELVYSFVYVVKKGRHELVHKRPIVAEEMRT